MSKRQKKKEKREKRSTAFAAKRRAETHKTGFENTSFEVPEDKSKFVLKNDKAVRLDIIPFEAGEGNPFADKGELYYERTYFIHRGIGVDQTYYVCLNKTCGDPCPICEHRAKLMKDPDADEDLIKDLGPKERQLFNVIDTKDRNKGVQIWDMSFHLFGKRLDQEIKNSDEDDNYDNFAELEGGFTLKCGVEEKSFGGGSSFYEVASIHFKSRKEDYDEDILEETTCLDDILIIKDYDELKQIFLQTTNNDDDDDDDDKDKKKKSEKGKKKENKKEPEPESEEPEWEVGDRVLAEIDDESYAGEITEVDADKESATVEFDDGDTQDVEFDNLEAEPEKTKKGKKSNKKDKDEKKGKKGKCPGGGKFGKDTDELDECADCPVWDECDDA